GAGDLVGASLLTLALDSVTLDVGNPTSGFHVSAGDLAMAILRPDSSADTRRWIAVRANLGTATLTLPSVSASGANLTLAINRATGTPNAPAALNWAASLDLNGDQVYDVVDPGQDLPTPRPLPLDFVAAIIRVTGSLTAFDLLGLITGNVSSFSFTKTGTDLEFAFSGVHANLPDDQNPIISLNNLNGRLISTASGIYGAANGSLHLADGLGFSFTGDFPVAFNTTTTQHTIDIDGDAGTTDDIVSLRAAADANTPYFAIIGTGVDLLIGDFDLGGDFAFIKNGTEIELTFTDVHVDLPTS